MMSSNEQEQILEFIERTKENLSLCSQTKYDVTLFINSLVGLLVVPKEKYFDELQDSLFTADILNEVKKCIKKDTYSRDRKYGITAKNIIIHIRNAIAHFHIELSGEKMPLKSDGIKITKITFYDCNIDSNLNITEEFEMVIPIETLKKFVIMLVDKILQIYDDGGNK